MQSHFNYRNFSEKLFSHRTFSEGVFSLQSQLSDFQSLDKNSAKLSKRIYKELFLKIFEKASSISIGDLLKLKYP